MGPLFGQRVNYSSPDAQRKQLLAQQLLREGIDTSPVQHWLQGAARMGAAGIGGYLSHLAGEEEKAKVGERQKTMAEALKALQGTPAPAAPTLAGGEAAATMGTGVAQNGTPPNRALAAALLGENPQTADLGFQMGMDAFAESRKPPITRTIKNQGQEITQQWDPDAQGFTEIGSTPIGANVGDPSAVREWQFFSQLPPEMQEQYLNMKRANRPMDAGGFLVVPSQVNPGHVTGAIQKTLPPEQLPETKGAQTTATETAKTVVEKQSMRPKAEMALQQFERKAQSVTSTIDKALDLAKNSATATGWGNMILGGLPNTDARALNNYLDTIRANLGFDQLQQMRAASPTGGALGAVSEMENRLLQATEAALDPLQANQLVQNLQIIKELYPKVLAEKRAAFDKDYGSGQAATPAPESANPAAPTRKRFNPETGMLE